ncbi:bifunctional adenosylcobinamide kinase/adenosylcobinamide-phosphate guanylyltransferase [Martelella alba]|uniref:Bifunctional adenosylcobalamin biosynthesis protein n=1 Tax=Martelella alba TaxID=2590451 RepID=A0A506UJA8_9HYPH|nr:bifunctional adenosylcobinamide kinase/adenosylcobinamide-phosphate guanylyltransferase [Martelella alba]TPW33343.1 bifunctional adenosylcobinamide kinase/adenosylcobinamide-phosphate guanylyltransferase [Martelella alba]
MAASEPAATASTVFILGGARSGKSRLAEQWASARSGQHHYIATAEAGDGEMAARIARHRAMRGSLWQTHEAPFALVDVLAEIAQRDAPVVLVDCLTLWLSNLMLADRDVAEESRRLAAFVETCTYPLFIVSNEVGQGIVPDNALARQFRDEAGFLNQTIAAVSSTVFFVAAGLPLKLKG